MLVVVRPPLLDNAVSRSNAFALLRLFLKKAFCIAVELLLDYFIYFRK